ncbi:D-alanyl-D-alanine carboxypeptidase/D-alanyl-D-alanine-endopeptidase [Nitriliruptoraceae bacterium ZYF776]|nr:D-alanyl-D-alanine carboxypeptidase/D-alanyl-D-alanine-endopeptidase [Profundirhabdus halotolerans]
MGHVARRPSSWRAAVAALVALTLSAGCTATAASDPVDPPATGPTAVDAAEPDGGADAEVVAPTPQDVADPEPPPAPPPSRAALEQRLQRYLDGALAVDAELELAVLVVDEHGRVVLAHEPDRAVLPASTLKTVTAAAVLTTLGPDARLTTALEATAGLDGSGRIDGDLVLRGVGDPTLTTDDYRRYVYPARPATPLDALADTLVGLGLREVTGDVLGTAPGFSGELRPTGWRDDYLTALDGRFVGGLTTDGGLRTLVERPGRDDGDDEEAGEVEGAEEAGDGDGDGRDRDEDVEDDEPPTVRVELAADPAEEAALALARALEARGVRIDGVARAGDPTEPVVGQLATVSSPPMHEVLRFMVQRSDNHLADQLFLVAGRARTGEGSWATGDRALRQTLDRFGVAHEGARFADGSGLSRDDRVTARLLVDLDRALTASPRWGATWRELMAVMGESGTLRTRLSGTPAAGRFLGKTGTLRDVTALSGQVVAAGLGDADAPRFHLAVLATGGPTGRVAARALVDETILALLAELDGCELREHGDTIGPLGSRPHQVAC